ncbi:hypothetical protein BX600DRAFT_517522 [Xylariales sp. PMI_506]|nr:hypothetical protein BX600DRAFT_517522 [Xylariales sp. PMI_506]
MRLELSFLLLAFLASPSNADDQSCPTLPGSAALTYTDGSFSLPKGNTPTYSSGSTMNISWTTDFEASTLWLITGCDFAAPTKSLVVGSTTPYYIWTIDTTSTNSSEVYLFRVVDSTANTTEQQIGGFLSASFYISGGPTSSSSTSSVTSTTSSSSLSNIVAPTTAGDTTTTASSSPTTTASASTSAGLSTGAKAGVGIGVAVGALGLLGLGAFFWRRSRNSQDKGTPMQAVATVPGGGNNYYQPQGPWPETHQAGTVSSAGGVQEYYKPIDHPHPPPSELGVSTMSPQSSYYQPEHLQHQAQPHMVELDSRQHPVYELN